MKVRWSFLPLQTLFKRWGQSVERLEVLAQGANGSTPTPYCLTKPLSVATFPEPPHPHDLPYFTNIHHHTLFGLVSIPGSEWTRPLEPKGVGVLDALRSLQNVPTVLVIYL